MDSHRFDQLTKQIASGVSRRQVLKGILSFAVGSLMSNFGFASRAYSYDGISATELQDEGIFLPHLFGKVCEQARTCEDRGREGFECGGYEGCFCIESTEGEIRCGKAPPCSSPTCTSSADCAELGPGYFCDVPNSGCCDEGSDVKLSRCIPPCGPGCAPALQCGDKCCAPSQTCADGVCVSSYDCALDQITPETLAASLAALEAGESVVNLTPQGCIKVRQELEDGLIVAKSFTVGNVTVLRWTREDNQWIGESDADRDGFFEWRSETTYSDDPSDFVTIETNFSPESGDPVRRKTLTPQADVVHILIERYNTTTEEWESVAEYDAAAVLGEELGDTDSLQSFSAMPHQGTCEANPCNRTAIKERMQQGVDNAAQCLPDFGDRGVEFYMRTYDILSRNMIIRCQSIDGPPQAAIENWANPDPNSPLIVIVDPSPEKYCGLNDEQRAWILYHEILHAAIKDGHDPDVEKLPEEQRKQLDRVYGCMALCYNNKSDPTKCMCAQCFGTVTCDPLCTPFKSDCGATCPCPAKNNEYFTTCSSCLASCPSGLGCFGYSYCDPVGQDAICSPPFTCP